jgi:hypothetical protein
MGMSQAALPVKRALILAGATVLPLTGCSQADGDSATADYTYICDEVPNMVTARLHAASRTDFLSGATRFAGVTVGAIRAVDLDPQMRKRGFSRVVAVSTNFLTAEQTGLTGVRVAVTLAASSDYSRMVALTQVGRDAFDLPVISTEEWSQAAERINGSEAAASAWACVEHL